MAGDGSRGRLALTAVAGSAVVVACCAALPAVIVALGGLTIAAWLGVATGALVVAGLAAALVLAIVARRRATRSAALRSDDPGSATGLRGEEPPIQEGP
ncbi:MAG: hypothetical protein ACR2LK_03390 [Solirubrobacteraceae bacterium]